MKKAKPCPWVLGDRRKNEETDQGPSAAFVEKEYVKNVYDSIANQWHGTRYKAWPKVESFIKAQRKGSLFGDIGCGNGKNLPACNSVGVGVGCDISVGLATIASTARNLEVPVADIMNLPYRSAIFDCVLCIAVLHHISTIDRRLQAISECIRVLKVGGSALFYAWAQEQEGGFSGHRFAEQDVLVPFHLKHDVNKKQKISSTSSATPTVHNTDVKFAAKHAVFDENKNATVFQRYCHVYKAGELESLFEKACNGSVRIDKVYWDTGNWAIIVTKER
mmetsp:Transcript_17352/g.22704  ORF Transcript_17352/g.22704 Transcript_17352/m.22704 type:complete len:277 (-) Transcript_17352:18-848(-)